MIRVRGVKVDALFDTYENRCAKLCKKINAKKEDIISIEILKQSLDARYKNNINYVYDFKVDVKCESKYLKNSDVSLYEDEKYIYPYKGNGKKIVIVGSGPAGLFCSYILAENGFKPIIIERGEDVKNRLISVQKFWNEGILNENSNVQFGEGGAGTFSDGKLTTNIKDSCNRIKKVLETFSLCGALKEITYSYKPHIGTDMLVEVIYNMRNKIIENGGKFLYNSCLTNIICENNHIKQIEINNKDLIDTDYLVLAIGHSARDTFNMLYENNINMEAKPFAVGLRIQHKQKDIDFAQYGKYAQALSKASYKLTYTSKSKRGIYSFCMCPGGYVVNASSEKGRLAINGMSNHLRDTENANSAIVISVTPDDFGKNPLDGVKFQRNLEEKAYILGKGNIPISLYKDYKKGTVSEKFNGINPIFKGNYTFSNLNELFSNNLNNDLKEAIDYFGTKINGFDNDNAILAGIESRTSSPVRIIRDENFESNIKGIYPCGEGAGYAGGITSAAVDGIRVAEAIGKNM